MFWSSLVALCRAAPAVNSASIKKKQASLQIFSILCLQLMIYEHAHLKAQPQIKYFITPEIVSRAERHSNALLRRAGRGRFTLCAHAWVGRATSNAGAAPLTRAVQRLGGPTLLTIAHIVPALYECRVLLREVRGCHVLVDAVERVLGPVAANSARGEHGLDRRTQRRSHLLGMEPLPVDTAEEGVRLEQ